MGFSLGGLSFGASKESSKNESQYTNQSQSQDQSTSFGNNQSSAFGTDQSTSFGQNQSTSGSYIDPTQGGFLQNLWGQASGLADPQGVQANIQNTLGQIMPGLQGTFQNLQGLTDPSQTIATQSQALQQGLGNLFNNEILPGIKGDAIASGGFGGGRQGVAEGVATGQLANSFTSGLADITSAANSQALQASQQLGTLGQGIMGLSQAGQTAGMDILSQLAGILGGPTVLQQSESAGTTGSQSTGLTGSQSTGATGSQSSGSSSSSGQGTASGKGSSSKWDLGF